MTAFVTCSGDSHYFNNILSINWDRKCDCGKTKLTQKQLDDVYKRANPSSQQEEKDK